jgi:HlyD family secretion protein
LSLKPHIHRIVARVPAGLLVLAAALGFWYLSRGMSTGSAQITGYAEALVHSVAPLQGGRIKAIPVRLGQPVRAGDVVAVLDSQPLVLQRARLQAELQQAVARLAAERDLQGAQLQRGELQIVRLSSAADRARAELQELDRQIERLEGLLAERLVRATEIEALRRRQRALAAEVAAHDAAAARDREGLGRRARGADEQQRRLEQRLEPFRAAVQVHEAALREIDHAIAQMTLRAPVDGTIGAITRRPGEVVLSGAEVLTVITAGPGRVVAFVPERLSRPIAPGAPVRLRRSGLFGGAVRGRVVELAPLVEEVPVRARPSPTVPAWGRRVVIHIEGPAVLLPGEAFHVGL